MSLIFQDLIAKIKKLEDDALTRRSTEEVERSLREVKEYASKKPTSIDRDVLFQKLVLFEQAARTNNHALADKATYALRRFHAHTDLDTVTQVVLAILSTKEEAALLAQEQRALKSRRLLKAKDDPADNSKPKTTPDQGFAPPPTANAAFQGYAATQWPYPNPWGQMTPQWQPRWRANNNRGWRNTRPDHQGNSTRPRGPCYLCGQGGHYMKDCPNAGTTQHANFTTQQQK